MILLFVDASQVHLPRSICYITVDCTPRSIIYVYHVVYVPGRTLNAKSSSEISPIYIDMISSYIVSFEVAHLFVFQLVICSKQAERLVEV